MTPPESFQEDGVGNNRTDRQLQVFHVLVPAGKTVELLSCLLPQSVLMSDPTDNPEIEEMPLLDDPTTPAADPEPVRSQSRRLPARKMIFWLLVVIVVFFVVAGAAAIWLYQPPLAQLQTSAAQSSETLMTAQEVVNAEPLPVSETVAQGQPGFSPDELENIPLPVGGTYESEEGLPLAKTEYEELLKEVRHQLRQNNDADLYLADQMAEIQKLVISIQTGQTIVAESLENRMNELAQKIDAMSEAVPPEAAPIPDASSMDIPPFRLIAIDRWENEWNAVLELNGKVSMLAPQSARAGWKLVRISPQNRTALFRSRNGTEAQLTVDG